MRFAEKSDIKNIRELWDIAFGEDKAFNDYFFENIFDVKYTLIMENNNEIVSMAQMLPYNIKGIGEVTYIYGAATLPKYRGMGCMKKLLEHSFKLDKTMGRAASILIPAEKSLFDYYNKIGYETEFYINKSVYTRKNNTDIIKIVDKNNIKNVCEIYNGDIVRTENYWNIQLNMINEFGGNIYIYNNAYAVVSDNIDEIFGDEKDKNILINSICKILKKDSITVIEKGGDTAFGMMKKHRNFENKKMYMNLMYN